MTTPDDFLEGAKQIASLPRTANDSIDRSVISRSYYAAYHAALDVVNRLILPPPERTVVGSHERVYQQLIECLPGHSDQHIAAKSIGLMAARTLKPYRVHADYFLSEALPANAEAETIARASKIVSKYSCILLKQAVQTETPT